MKNEKTLDPKIEIKRMMKYDVESAEAELIKLKEKDSRRSSGNASQTNTNGIGDNTISQSQLKNANQRSSNADRGDSPTSKNGSTEHVNSDSTQVLPSAQGSSQTDVNTDPEPADSSQLQEESSGQGTLAAKLKSDESKKTKAARRAYSEYNNIFDALKEAAGKKLLICIKGYPDPDNIGSSLALKWLASQYEIETSIIHFDEISHHENRALVKKLDIELELWNESYDLDDFDYYAINDSQSPHLPIKLPEEMELLVFVDHHKSLGKVSGKFVDIRESVGSTSAIYGEYLRDGPHDFAGNGPDETKIATALMHGIRSDTDNFTNATGFDYELSSFISRFVDKDLLYLISKQSIPAKTMDLTQVALQRKDIRGQFMFSGVGFVRDEDRDGIGQCADYLLYREGIDTVVVYGVVGGEFVDGSLRTRSHTLDPDKWIKDVFGADKDGKYYGGGRKDKGGFQIPLGVFSKCKDKELLWILIKKTIDELFYEKIGVEASTDMNGDISGT